MKINKIVFIGFMCSGKTVVAESFAKKIGAPHIDLDNAITEYSGKTIKEIFDEVGEEKFRELESEFALLMENAEKCVVSTGGGVVLNEENMKYLGNCAIIVYLKATKETILQNYKKTDVKRPLLEVENVEEKVRQLLEERAIIYEKYANKTIEVDGKEIDNIVKEILKGIKP